MVSYTLHALDKVKTKEAKKFKIDKKLVEKAIKKGLVIEVEEDVITIAGNKEKT